MKNVLEKMKSCCRNTHWEFRPGKKELRLNLVVVVLVETERKEDHLRDILEVGWARFCANCGFVELGGLQCHSLRQETMKEEEFVGSGDAEFEMAERCTKINGK